MPSFRPSTFARVGVILAGVLWASSSRAAAVATTFEPIVGYERVQTLLPTPHAKDRLLYGARLTAGFVLFSLETEYFRATDTETFNPPETVTDTADKLRIGVRSTIRLFRLLSLIARAGGQAARTVLQDTVGGVTTRTPFPLEYHPYAGFGLRLHLGSLLSLSADLTTVFHNFPRLNNNEYQTTAGLAVAFP